jgi:ankyrin repeat protein
VIKVLSFLALAARPVLLMEVADFIAMDLENRRIDVDAQFQDPQDILTICSSLVTSTESSWHSVAEINKYACGDAVRQDLFARIHSRSLSRNYPGEELKLAHLSVKEWISSSAYSEIVTTRVGVGPKGPDFVAQTCLAYLLQFNTLRNFTKTSIVEYPFLNYAVYHWLHHVETCLTENSSLTTKQMVCDLTKLNEVQFLNVAFVFNEACYHRPDRTWRSQGRSLVARWRDYVQAAKRSGEKWDLASPLYWAAQFGKRKACELLIAEGADANASGGPMDTPLNAAIAEGYDSVVQLLITSGADIEPKGGHQYSPLQHACMKLNLEVVKILINAKVNVNAIGEEPTSALALAVDWGDNGAILQLLLDAGANLNLREWPDINLLRMACGSWDGAKNGNGVVVKMLLDHGADIHYRQDTGDTALALAVGSGNLPAVRLLVEEGASLSTQNRKRRTLLMEACCYGGDQDREEIVRHLINNGAEINAQLEENPERNALCTSLAKGAGATIVRLLLERGADPNLAGGREKMPLQIASEADGSDEVIALLLRYGANENGLLWHCSTALQEAAFMGRDTIVALLLDRGANVNQIAGQYSTALCAAAYCGHVKVVRRLLSNGANVDIKNDHGWTATAFAFVQGHDHVLKELAEPNLNSRSPLSNRGLPPDSVLAADSSSNVTISLDGLTVSAGKSRTCVTVDSHN